MSIPFRLKPRDYLGDAARKRQLNEVLFTTVAPRYDRITRLLSLGRDQAWKRRLVSDLPNDLPAPVCLDLACGTGDLTQRLTEKYPHGHIIGLDLTTPMLDRARARVKQAEFRCGDMACTGLQSGSVDLITGGYALRNAGDLSEALAESFRLLKPGGRADFLDFAKPPGRVAQRLVTLLLRVWGGLWGLLLHGNPDVYGYIADSLEAFPDRLRFQDSLTAAGFHVAATHRFLGGLVEWVTVLKPPSLPPAGPAEGPS